MACIPDAPIDALAAARAQGHSVFSEDHPVNPEPYADTDNENPDSALANTIAPGPRLTALVTYFTLNLTELLERAPLSKRSLRRDDIRDVFIDEALSDQGPDIPVPLEDSDDQSILYIIAENEWIAELGTMSEVCGPEDDIMTAAHALCALAFRNALRDAYPGIVNSLDHF